MTTRVKKRLWTTTASAGWLLLAHGLSYGQSAPSSSPSVPSATNDVKPGDWIIWQAHRNILVEVPNTSSSAKTPATTPTPEENAAAANALKAAAEAAILPESKAAFAANGSQADNDKLRAAVAAAAQADTAAQKAGAANSKPATGPGAVAAALKLKTAAQSSLDNAVNEEIQALQQANADQTALANAKMPTQAMKDKAAASQKAATAKLVAEADARAYRDAASSAYDKVAAEAASGSPSAFCAPPGSRFLVTNIKTASDSPEQSSANSSSSAAANNGGGAAAKSAKSTGTSSSSASSSKEPTVEGYYISHFALFHFQAIKEYPPLRSEGGTGTLTPPANVASPCGPGTVLASYDTLYQFPATPDNTSAYYREGFTWGAMLIPYKFYLKDKTFKGNPSTVAFIGYEGWFPAMSLAGVVALGPGIAQTPSTTAPNTKSTSTTSAVTYTAATGLVATFGGAIKAGLLVGWDWQGSGSNFQYEGKTWLALSIGTSF